MITFLYLPVIVSIIIPFHNYPSEDSRIYWWNLSGPDTVIYHWWNFLSWHFRHRRVCIYPMSEWWIVHRSGQWIQLYMFCRVYGDWLWNRYINCNHFDDWNCTYRFPCLRSSYLLWFFQTSMNVYQIHVRMVDLVQISWTITTVLVSSVLMEPTVKTVRPIVFLVYLDLLTRTQLKYQINWTPLSVVSHCK